MGKGGKSKNDGWPEDMKTNVNWDTEEYPRRAMACLAKSINVIENDKLDDRTQPLAPVWYRSYHFCLKEKIIDCSGIIGAVFELEEPWRHPSAPNYVVAFRGTMLSHPNVLRELTQDGLILFNALPDYKRFQIALDKVQSLTSSSSSDGGGKVWLAGYSFGASLGLDIGRHLMEEKGQNLRTFLFNPPCVSLAPALDTMLEGDAMTGLYTVSYALKYVVAQVVSPHRKRTKQVFEKLSPWVPELYVHADDFISKGYIQYFEQRQLVYEKYPAFGRTAIRLSYRDLFNSVFAKDHLRSHLLPSAKLHINSYTCCDAHSLE